MSTLKTTITKDGQRYLDEPILVQPKRQDPLERAIAEAYGKLVVRPPITVGHERVRLRWMTGDGKGGLKPREVQ